MGQKAARLFQSLDALRHRHALGCRLADLIQPRDQLQVAEAAGRLLDIRLQMIKRGVEFLVAVARELAQIAHQAVALPVNEAGQALRQPGV